MPSIPDIALIVIVIILTIRCIVRGFIEEFLSMAALICGIAGAVFLSGPVGKLVEKYFQLSMWSHIIAFLGCFLVIYLIVKILEGFLHSLFDKLNLEKLDKALGLLLGLVEGFLVVALLVFAVNWFKWLPLVNFEALLKQSVIAKFILSFLAPPAAAKQTFDIFYHQVIAII